jgi:seryl-tRNA synthetase
MLDLLLIHLEKGGNPEVVFESQKKRFKSVEDVQKCIDLYTTWRQKRSGCDTLRMNYSAINKKIAEKKKASKGADKCEVNFLKILISIKQSIIFYL